MHNSTDCTTFNVRMPHFRARTKKGNGDNTSGDSTTCLLGLVERFPRSYWRHSAPCSLIQNSDSLVGIRLKFLPTSASSPSRKQQRKPTLALPSCRLGAPARHPISHYLTADYEQLSAADSIQNATNTFSKIQTCDAQRRFHKLMQT